MRLTKEIFKTFLLFFSGVLINLSVSGNLNTIYSIVLFLGAFVILLNIVVCETLLTRYKEKIDTLRDIVDSKEV